MSIWRAHLFGPPTIASESRIIEGFRHKTIALLAYIGVEGRPIGRDTLATLLWPNSGQSQARANLRCCLHQFSGKLNPSPISCHNNNVELNKNLFQIDVCEFRQLVSLIKSENNTGQREKFLHSAEQVCRGPFLEGFTLPDCPDFDTWEFLNEDLFRRQLTAVLSELAELAGSHGDWTDSLRLGRRLIELDPLEENSHRLMMRLLADSGQRSEALRQYGECRRFLQSELKDEPERETKDLYHSIKDGKYHSLRNSRPSQIYTAFSSALALQTSSFFGRSSETAAIQNLFQKGVRLCTLFGPGGSGKTRTALEATRFLHQFFPGGIIFIDLTRVKCSKELPLAIARALGLRETYPSEDDLFQALTWRLSGPNTLLILDNFEHLIECTGFVDKILTTAKHLYFLATSREALRIKAEHTLQILPFDVNGPEMKDAVGLFRDRAASLLKKNSIENIPDKIIIEICRQLDGLPLAIELAVPLLNVFSIEELQQALSTPLTYLDVGAHKHVDRHSSLQQTIDWSYHLLTKEEAKLFRLLSVFSGGFTLEAVKALGCTDSPHADQAQLLRSLIEKSLVIENGRLKSGEKRFGLLETVRQYAHNLEIKNRNHNDLVHRHSDYYCDLVFSLCSFFHGPHESDAMNRLEKEHANTQLALQTLHTEEQFKKGLELCNVLQWYWYIRGHFTTGEDLISSFLGKLPKRPSSVRSRGIAAHAWLLFVRGEWRKAHALYTESLYCSRRSLDQVAEARALAGVGVSLRWMGDNSQGSEYTEQAITVARRTDDPALLVHTLIWAYATTGGSFTGDPPVAQLEEAATLSRQRGDRWSYAHTLNGLGDLFSELGNYERAKTDYQLSLQLFQELEDRWMIAWSEEGLGLLSLRQRQLPNAAAHTARALELFHALGDQMNVAIMMVRIADIQLQLSHSDSAALLAGGASLIIDSLDNSDLGLSPRLISARNRCAWYEHGTPLIWSSGRNLSQHELLKTVSSQRLT
ncbi:MAG: AAA family ATPase [Spirochaetaceae bacterium]|nr:AAA family ATPase [Spirochaetaceae bacterium]MCF7949614.1 AAA family ATPase [Spirochaetia bacterium]MCF7951971.1 AAA family ATPase [Spirochaetaceae bacterium]